MERIYIYYGISVGTFPNYIFATVNSNARSDMINIYNDYLNVSKVLHCLYQATMHIVR